jgi:hypothetical protein
MLSLETLLKILEAMLLEFLKETKRINKLFRTLKMISSGYQEMLSKWHINSEASMEMICLQSLSINSSQISTKSGKIEKKNS